MRFKSPVTEGSCSSSGRWSYLAVPAAMRNNLPWVLVSSSQAGGDGITRLPSCEVGEQIVGRRSIVDQPVLDPRAKARAEVLDQRHDITRIRDVDPRPHRSRPGANDVVWPAIEKVEDQVANSQVASRA